MIEIDEEENLSAFCVNFMGEPDEDVMSIAAQLYAQMMGWA